MRQRHSAGRRRQRDLALEPRLGERGEPDRRAVLAELVDGDEQDLGAPADRDPGAGRVLPQRRHVLAALRRGPQLTARSGRDGAVRLVVPTNVAELLRRGFRGAAADRRSRRSRQRRDARFHARDPLGARPAAARDLRQRGVHHARIQIGRELHLGRLGRRVRLLARRQRAEEEKDPQRGLHGAQSLLPGWVVKRLTHEGQ